MPKDSLNQSLSLFWQQAIWVSDEAFQKEKKLNHWELVMHTLILFFQMITLNVAINFYSNALLSLLISNQFVEIKQSVFKRFEKENLFQLTCSGNKRKIGYDDVVDIFM